MDDSLLYALKHNVFLHIALLSGLFASIASGLMGSYVMIKRIPSITGSIAHSVLGGIGIFLFLQYQYNLALFDPLYGAFIASLIAAFLVYRTHLKHKQNEGAIIATIWSMGMSLGIIFTSFVKGYKADIASYLFGNILLAASHHIYFLIALDAIIILCTFLFYKKFLMICLDEEQARISGINVEKYYFILIGLISLSIVLLIHVMGVILVVTLISIPPTIASLFTAKLVKMMGISMLLNFIFITLGILISYELDWAPGPTASLLTAISYLLVLSIKAIPQKKCMQ